MKLDEKSLRARDMMDSLAKITMPDSFTLSASQKRWLRGRKWSKKTIQKLAKENNQPLVFNKIEVKKWTNGTKL